MGNFCYTCKKEFRLKGKIVYLIPKMWTYNKILQKSKRDFPIGFTSEDKLCDKCYKLIPEHKTVKNQCYACKKELKLHMMKWVYKEIVTSSLGNPAMNVPEGFRFKDRLCSDCLNNLPRKSNSDKPKKINTEYHTEKQKDCSLVRDSDESCSVYFEISSIKLNGEFIDQNLFSLSSEYPNFYQFLIWKKSKIRKEAELFCRFWFGTPPSEYDMSTWTEDYGSFDKFSTFQFDSKTGKLIIVTNGISKKVNRFEIQLKFANQALVLARFLLFTNLRKKKINDKTIKEIKLKNNSKKIKLEKNSDELHEHEEVLAEFFKSNRTRYNDDSKIITDYVIVRITNFKIINDVWYTPLCFIENNNDVSEKSKEDIMNDIQENSIFNFTHDEYDDVIASNVTQTTSSTGFRTGGVNAVSVYGFGVNQDTHSYQGTTTGNESGDIIFMSKGKKLLTWENFVDPKGIVEMIKSAKSQFESQDEKIPEPAVSSSDDDPLKILKIRLAKGEITLEEFNKIKENLE